MKVIYIIYKMIVDLNYVVIIIFYKLRKWFDLDLL